jgi:hypothetical protein
MSEKSEGSGRDSRVSKESGNWTKWYQFLVCTGQVVKRNKYGIVTVETALDDATQHTIKKQ